MADLRDEIADEIAAGLVRGGLANLSKAEIYHRFQDRGASRATVYRSIDDALRLAAERGATEASKPSDHVPPNAGSFPLATCVPVTEIEAGDAMLALGPLATAFGELDRAMLQLRLDGSLLLNSIAGIGHAICRLRASAGPSDHADNFVAAVIDGMTCGGPAFSVQIRSVFNRLGGA
jgi:hypothetical protein